MNEWSRVAGLQDDKLSLVKLNTGKWTLDCLNSNGEDNILMRL